MLYLDNKDEYDDDAEELMGLYQTILDKINTHYVDLVGNEDFLCWATTYDTYPSEDGISEEGEPEKPALDEETKALFTAPATIGTIEELAAALGALYEVRAEQMLEFPIVIEKTEEFPFKRFCSDDINEDLDVLTGKLNDGDQVTEDLMNMKDFLEEISLWLVDTYGHH